MALFSLLDVVGSVHAPRSVIDFLGLFATIIFPTLLIVVLIALPFIDKNPSRRLSRRPIVLTCTGLVLGGAIILSFYGQYHVQAAASAARHQHGIRSRTTSPRPPAVPAAAQPRPSMTAGATVYTANCAGCHGAAGTGQPGVFPPLANNPLVTGPADKVITIVEHGLTDADHRQRRELTTARCRPGRAT